MAENNKTMIGVVMALIMSLTSVGVNVMDTDVLENYYICNTSLETGEFARLSGTLYTAYPNELDNKGYRRCIDTNGNKGIWVNVKQYSEDNNIDIVTLIPYDDEKSNNKPISYTDNTKSYNCNNNGVCIAQ